MVFDKGYNLIKLTKKLRHFIESNLPFYNLEKAYPAYKFVMNRYLHNTRTYR
jgi:hypothetical protein